VRPKEGCDLRLLVPSFWRIRGGGTSTQTYRDMRGQGEGFGPVSSKAGSNTLGNWNIRRGASRSRDEVENQGGTGGGHSLESGTTYVTKKKNKKSKNCTTDGGKRLHGVKRGR